MQKKLVKVPQRVAITTQDIMNVTGVKRRTAQRYMQQMRMCFEKESYQFITVREFSAFSGIDEEEIREFMVK